MQFNELIKEVNNVIFTTVRQESGIYFEAVVAKKELANLTTRLENFFGPPMWPLKNNLPSQVQEAIRDFGGIMPGQTLYFWNQGNDTVFAMLWPWQDGEHITIKMVKK